jgi:Immune inhibitor A peptidase M6
MATAIRRGNAVRTGGSRAYQTFDPATGTCSPTGTTGEWNAANGSSSGWQQFQIDLSRYAGQQVEVSITALSDWGLQQFPGVFIDDIEVSTGEGTTSFEDDADPMDGWDVPGAPQDEQGIEGPNRNDWIRRAGLGIKEGAVVAAARTLYIGFGFEGISDAGTRNDVMGRTIDYLLP